jgi:hypothetical protein
VNFLQVLERVQELELVQGQGQELGLPQVFLLLVYLQQPILFTFQ